MKPTKIDALIRLLADDDPKIRSVAREHLLSDVDSTRPLLEENSLSSSDATVRVAAGKLLEDIERSEHLNRWHELATGDAGPDLEEGAFLLAHVECPRAPVESCRSTLDDFARVLDRRVSGSRDPETVFPRMCHLLFREIGLRGNRENYHDPANSFLHEVLDRKLGIPVSLSVVCMLVARRLGMVLEGVGLPGHFIVRYYADRSPASQRAASKQSGRLRAKGSERYLDPFNGGQPWSLEDCVQHLHAQGYTPLEDDLRAYTDSEILIRMLSNLLVIHENSDDADRKARVVSMLQSLNGRRELRR